MLWGVSALLLFVAVSMSQAANALTPRLATIPATNEDTNLTVSAGGDLVQDLNDLALYVPTKAINRLVLHYLLTDEAFQTAIRAINSPQVIFWLMRLRNQPELLQLHRWICQQKKLSSLSEEWDDGDDFTLIDPTPIWFQSSDGLIGFINELKLLLPLDAIRQQIQLKANQSGIFAELMRRIQNLLPIYERAINDPVAQRLWSELRPLGLDASAIDGEIRTLLGWLSAN